MSNEVQDCAQRETHKFTCMIILFIYYILYRPLYFQLLYTILPSTPQEKHSHDAPGPS